MVIRMRQTNFSGRLRSYPPDLFSISVSSRHSELALKIWASGLALLLWLIPACKPKEIQALLAPSQAMVSVLAEEAARLAGSKKQVALITHALPKPSLLGNSKSASPFRKGRGLVRDRQSQPRPK